MIDKDEMLSCMEPEALKAENDKFILKHTQMSRLLIKYVGLEK